MNTYSYTDYQSVNLDWIIQKIIELEQKINSGGGGGTTDHTQLINRDAANQHPIASITGLATALAGKQPAGNYVTDVQLNSAVDAALADAKASGEFDGTNGTDGYSPSATVTQTPTGATISITDKTGTTTATVTNGKDAYVGTWHVWQTLTVPSGGSTALDFSTSDSGEQLSDKNVTGLFVYSPHVITADAVGSATLTLNNKYGYTLSRFTSAAAEGLHLLITAENGMPVVRYYQRDTANTIIFPAVTYQINRAGFAYSTALTKTAIAILGAENTMADFISITHATTSGTAINAGTVFNVYARY